MDSISYSLKKQMVFKNKNSHEDKLGFHFILVLFYLFLEYCRPSNPMKIPMIISFLLFFGWLFNKNKKSNPQIIFFYILLGVMYFDIIIAENTYIAFWTTYNMTITIAYICVPLIHFVNSFKKIQIFTNVFIAIFLYIGIYSIFHSGFGPAGAAGGQDQNYVGQDMAMAIPFAYFSIYQTKSVLKKILFVAITGIFLLAIVISASRGGFVGLVAVLLYCLIKSPKKWVGISITSLMVVVLLVFGSQVYWQEANEADNRGGIMRRGFDPNESTADLRIQFWKIAFRMFLHYPITGVGPGNFRWRMGEFQAEEQVEHLGRSLGGSAVVHSLYFEILSELGFIGAFLFIAILYNNNKDMKFISDKTKEYSEHLKSEKLHILSEDKDNFLKYLTCAQYYRLAITGGLIGCLVPAAFLSMFYFSHFWVLSSMVVALKEVTVEHIKREK